MLFFYILYCLSSISYCYDCRLESPSVELNQYNFDTYLCCQCSRDAICRDSCDTSVQVGPIMTRTLQVSVYTGI